MAEGLRTQLIGAWKLVSYQELPVDGSEPFEPLDHEPQGIIMYTPDGYMSAQLSKPNRPTFASGDWFDATTEDYVTEAKSYIAYSGPFYVDEDKQTLSHSMFVSLFPTGSAKHHRAQSQSKTTPCIWAPPHPSSPQARPSTRCCAGSGGAEMSNARQAYIQFTPGLITEDGDVTDESTAQFLLEFIEQFAQFVTRVPATHHVTNDLLYQRDPLPRGTGW